MASGSGIMGWDSCWKYCTPMEGNKNGTICNYCGLTIKSGGITRFKFYLSHNPNSNTKKCTNVLPKVKQEIRRLLEEKNKAKVKKAADIEDIWSELGDTMGGRHRHVIDDDEENLDDDEEDDDVYMYLADMHPNEQHAYRAVVWGSKASKWNWQQEEHFIKGKVENWLINLNYYCFLSTLSKY